MMPSLERMENCLQLSNIQIAYLQNVSDDFNFVQMKPSDIVKRPKYLKNSRKLSSSSKPRLSFLYGANSS